MDEILSFGQWLKARRKALDLTQEDLAQRIACALITIQKMEADERRPSKQIAALLAHELSVPSEERAAFIRFARAPEQVALSDAFQRAAPWRTRERRHTNLPALPAILFGRDEDVAAIKHRILNDRVRLLTLIGPAGIGKTSLAVRAAEELLDEFDDGVFFVALAPITDPELVVLTIARTLDVTERAGEFPLARLKKHLAAKRMLLVLDNLEQVIAAAPQLGELLAACPWLRLLVTSRASLHLRAERAYLLRPLVVPDPRQLPPLDTLSQIPAVALLVDRAQVVQPAFSVTTENAPALAEICARLDGIPLAIELIAARLGPLSPETVLARLAAGRPAYKLLTRGPRDLPARQRTLHHALRWSYELLDEQERVLFARLGVFVGGFTGETVEAVRAAEWVKRGSLQKRLQSLADKSLIVQLTRAPGIRRWMLFELIREFALEQLEHNGEAEAIRQQHAAYFCALAETAEPYLGAPEQEQWLQQLDTERNNLRAALSWANERGQHELLLRMAAALRAYWETRGDLTEGRKWLELALARTESVPTRAPILVRAKLLQGAGTLAQRQGENARTRELYEEALELFRAMGDTRGTADLLGRLGEVALEHGALSEAQGFFEASIPLLQQVGDQERVAFALIALGHLAMQNGAYELANVHLEASLRLHREAKHHWGIANALIGLGDAARCQGDYARAWSCYDESLALLRALGHKGGTSAALANLGYVASHRNDLEGAAKFFRESLELARELGFKSGIANCLGGFGGLAKAAGQSVLAARLLGAAEALEQETGAQAWAADRAEFQRVANELCTDLTPSEFSVAWNEGRAMESERALADALTLGAIIESGA